MSIAKEILDKISEYDAINDVYMNDETLSDADEDILLEKMDNVVNEAVDLIVKFTPSIDRETADKMFRFYGDKLKEICLKGC